MKNFLIDSLKKSQPYMELINSIENNLTPIKTHGINPENLGHILYALNNHSQRQLMLITYEETRARNIYEDIVNLGSKRTYLFPNREMIFYNIDAHSNEENIKRLEVLAQLAQGEDIILVASIESIFDKILSKSSFRERTKTLEIGDQVDLDGLVELFVAGGYERVAMVEGVGQFSIRGGIIDFFPAHSQDPIRIELFDNEVDSIRSFHRLDQRSLDQLDRVSIIPAQEVLILDQHREKIIEGLGQDMERALARKKLEPERREKIQTKFQGLILKLEEKIHISNRDILIPYIPEDFMDNIIDYLSEDAVIIIDEPKRVEEKHNMDRENFLANYQDLFLIGELLEGHMGIFSSQEEVRRKLEARILIENSALLSGGGTRKEAVLLKFVTKATQSYHKKMELFLDDINYYRKNKYRIVITSGTEERGKRLRDRLAEENIGSSFIEDTNRSLDPGEVVIVAGSLKGGFEYPEDKFVVINDEDIFGGGKRRAPRKKSKDSKAIVSFTDLKVGDYVVHENHGIGRYEGVRQLDVQGIKKDYLNISYRAGDRLYVPIDQMNLIQKYIGSDSVSPKINKLSSAEWAKAKRKAQLAVEEMAGELLELYAKRKQVEGYAFSPDSDWQHQFEDSFPFEETEGQLRSIEEIKEDMERKKPMERLLCGDVGYGKTEVALRAAFKAVLDGKQVAFLVPTTILAQQHYNTMEKRFKDFPVKISFLSRFRTALQQKNDIKKLREGRLDIIVGTHRLLSDDVKFKDLGLLIIDEEQRFGVKHKEKLKQLKENIDVLTLTATPIPRTLHMSLSGIRDMSVIEEPPEERYPVQTYVVEENQQLIRDAILKEVSRGGQVYYVYNKVKTIDKMAAQLKSLVPEASFAVAHGQMNEKMLENVMMDFYQQEFDVLVCTTIIETGLDIPNVNTIIINDADRFGLSQLYQLRGRVGRANRMAYGYFTYPENKVLSEVAERRLLAIKEFTEFGSGFKIAMRDLEIRGAGNLLGAQQHGQIEAIGYDLYVKFLNDAVRRLQGEEVEEVVETIIDLEVDGYISKKYIGDEEQKVDIYKRIASVENIEEYRELVDELIDRFGDLPKEVENLMDVSYIRSIGSRNNIKSLIQSGKDVSIDFDREDKIRPELIHYLSESYSYRIKFNLTKNPGFKYAYRKNVLDELKALMENIDAFNKGEIEI